MGPFLDYLGSEDGDLLKRLRELAEEYRGRGSLFHDLEGKPELRAVHDGLGEAWRGYLRALLPTAPEPPVSATLPVELREQLELDLGLPSASGPSDVPVGTGPPPVPDVPSRSPEPIPLPLPDSIVSRTPWWQWVILVVGIAALALAFANDTTIIVKNVGNGAVHNVTFRFSLGYLQDQNSVIAEIGPRSSREFKPPRPSIRWKGTSVTLRELSFTDVSGRVYSRYVGRYLFSSGLEEITIRIGEAGDVDVVHRYRGQYWRWAAWIFLALVVLIIYVRGKASAPSQSGSFSAL